LKEGEVYEEGEEEGREEGRGVRPGVEVRFGARATWRKDLLGVLAVVEGEGEEEEEDAAEVVAELEAEAERAGKCVSSLALKGGPEEEEEEEEEVEEVSEGLPSSPSNERTSCQNGHSWGVLLSSSSMPSRQEPSNQWIHVILSMA